MCALLGIVRPDCPGQRWPQVNVYLLSNLSTSLRIVVQILQVFRDIDIHLTLSRAEC